MQIWIEFGKASLNKTLSIAATGAINYLYTRLKFNWTEYEYTVYSSTAVTVGTLTNVALLPLLSIRFKIRDATLGTIGAISGLAQNIVRAFACKWWMMYLGKTHTEFPNIHQNTYNVLFSRFVRWCFELWHLHNCSLNGLQDSGSIWNREDILPCFLIGLTHPNCHRPWLNMALQCHHWLLPRWKNNYIIM